MSQDVHIRIIQKRQVRLAWHVSHHYCWFPFKRIANLMIRALCMKHLPCKRLIWKLIIHHIIVIWWWRPVYIFATSLAHHHRSAPSLAFFSQGNQTRSLNSLSIGMNLPLLTRDESLIMRAQAWQDHWINSWKILLWAWSPRGAGK